MIMNDEELDILAQCGISPEQISDTNYLAQLRLYSNLKKYWDEEPEESLEDFIRNADDVTTHIMKSGKYIHTFCSQVLPHLEQTNFVFPFFPFTPIIVPAIAPAGPNKPPTILPQIAFSTENFFFVSIGMPTPSQVHLGHLIVLPIKLFSFTSF